MSLNDSSSSSMVIHSDRQSENRGQKLIPSDQTLTSRLQYIGPNQCYIISMSIYHHVILLNTLILTLNPTLPLILILTVTLTPIK